jgi:hypothetical protein
LVLAVCQLFTNGALLSWFFVFAFIENISSRSGCGNVEKSGGFFAGLFQALEGSDAFCRFPQARHFHSRFARLVVCPLAFARLGCANGSGQEFLL